MLTSATAPACTLQTLGTAMKVIDVFWMVALIRPAMLTLSNQNIFRVACPLCGESTGHRCIAPTKASDVEL